MKTKSTILLLLILASLSCFAQQEADLKKFVKIPDLAEGAIYEIDSISLILVSIFIDSANNHNSTIHKDIQSFFDDFKLAKENNRDNVYPTILKSEHLSSQFLDYSNNYGWVGQTADSVFNTSRLTILLAIPAFDNFHKGQAVNTICFKMAVDMYTESDLKTDKVYKRNLNIIELKKIEF